MRGAPLQQAIILLLTLSILGYPGYRFIQMESSPTIPPVRDSPTNQKTPQVRGEIELIFSTPPKSYQLKHPSTHNTTETTLLTSPNTKEIENPSYADVTLPSHQLTTYWLDITWPEAPKKLHRHFVKITLSPNNGASRSFSFFCDSAEMKETFDYSTAESASKPARHE